MKRNSNQRQIPKKALVSASVIFLTVAIDQFTKLLVVKSSISWACNFGFAFGLLPGFLNGLIVFAILSALVYLFFKQKAFVFYTPFALIIGGGISNLTDRIFKGCVVDFIRVPLWPTTFNLADAAITLGVAIIISGIIFGRNTSKNGTR